MTDPTLIVGAGMAGLIAAHAWPRAAIVEAGPEVVSGTHKALLRFRSDAVARLTGIEFRAVTVRKGIWYHGKYVAPDIQMANLYAQKVLPGGLVGDRSIWNLDAVQRFIAPETFYEQLLDSVRPRVTWGTACEFGRLTPGLPLVNTAPMELALQALPAAGRPEFEFRRAPIIVQRFRVPGADVHQTAYFPHPGTRAYRASITGDLLIVESVPSMAGLDGPLGWSDEDDIGEVAAAFGLRSADLRPLESVKQRYGKIAPVPDAARRNALFRLSHEAGIYSLGRFATWRNVLLDDVVEDVAVIKRLIRTADSYQLRKHA